VASEALPSLWLIDRVDPHSGEVVEQNVHFQPVPRNLAETIVRWLTEKHPEHHYHVREAK
jgi:hypothetical protein